MRYLLALLLYTFCSQSYADDIQGAARDLGQYYYKGSRFEEQVSTYYKSLPIQLQTTLSYFPYLQQIFIAQYVSFVISFP